MKKHEFKMESLIIILSVVMLVLALGEAYFAVNLYHGRWIVRYWSYVFTVFQGIEIILAAVYVFRRLKAKEKLSEFTIVLIAAIWSLALLCESTISGYTYMYSEVKFVKSAAYMPECKEYIYLIEEEGEEWSALQMIDATEEKIERGAEYDMVSGICWKSLFGQLYRIDDAVKH